MSKDFIVKVVVTFLIIISLIIMVCFIQPAQKCKTIEEYMYNAAVEVGLQDVEISVYKVESRIYHAEVYCSNFSSFEPEEMFAIQKALIQSTFPVEDCVLGIEGFIEENDVYWLSSDSLSVYKNNKQIYSDWDNSILGNDSYDGNKLPEGACTRCSGTGKVTQTYGESWSQEDGYGYGDICGKCGGSGRA